MRRRVTVWKWKFICSWIAPLQAMTKLSVLGHIFQKWVRQQRPSQCFSATRPSCSPGECVAPHPGTWVGPMAAVINRTLWKQRCPDLSEAPFWPEALCFMPLETLAPGMLLRKPSHHAVRSPSHRERLPGVNSPVEPSSRGPRKWTVRKSSPMGSSGDMVIGCSFMRGFEHSAEPSHLTE